jgi:hypothetical protein
MFMIRFILKVISLPLIAVTALAGLFLRFLANLSSYIAGPLLIFIVICDLYSLFMRSWRDVFLLTLIGAALLGAYLCAGILIGLIEDARDGLRGFLHS